MVRIRDFCQVHVRGSRISLLQQSQEQAVPKQYTTNWTKMIRERKTSPYSSWLFWLVVFQSLSCVQLFATPWTAACQASFTISQSLLKLIQPSHPQLPLFSCPQSFPASRSFPRSWLFASGGQSMGVSASALVLPRRSVLGVHWKD